MGSILSKLFGGGNHNHSHGSAQQPPPALLPPPTGAATSSQQHQQQQLSSGTALPRSTSSASSKHPSTGPTAVDGLATGQQAVITPAPINILEVEVDEEAFREAASPPIYTSTIKAQIDPLPPHPLELQHGTPKPTLVAHLATVDVPNGGCQQQTVVPTAPIATLDSDYEDELIIGQESAEIEEAVIKIQAGVRGYLVRKQIHANHAKSPIKSISLDESVLSIQRQPPENILPPPESFETVAAATAASAAAISKPLSIQSKHRVETPIPGSPFAQDDTDYSILDAVDPEQEAVEQSTVPLIASTEELEIFKKINEINQLLASKDDDDDGAIAVVPEPPKQLPAVANLQSTAATMMNSAVSSSSINNALSELDQTIREQEMTLPPEEAVEENDVKKEEEEVIVLESAFTDIPLNQPSPTAPVPPMSPSVLVKAPSLEVEEEEEPVGLLGDPLESALLSETAAAIRIQAAFRGYEVRKSLSREVSPARSTEEEKVVVTEESNAVAPEAVEEKSTEVDQSKEEAIAQPMLAAPASAAEETKDGAAKPTAEDFQEILSLIPQPVNEELCPVMELSDQEIIEDVEEKQQTVAEVSADAQITSGGEEQPPQKPQQPATDADVNVAVKEGFGTLASSVKAAETAAAAAAATAEEVIKEAVPVPDIEKSIKELEKSFDRDLLADVASEATASVAAAATPFPTPATPIVIEAESVSSPSQQQPSTVPGNEEESQISIEPPTPEISSQQQAPVFSSTEPPSQLPSKIPVLDRQKSILKEPSSPEPHTYSNLSPMLSSPDGGNDDSDEESCSTPSPIPLRSSSPSPFSKKRPRRHRKKK